jgi:acyl carrier protein
MSATPESPTPEYRQQPQDIPPHGPAEAVDERLAGILSGPLEVPAELITAQVSLAELPLDSLAYEELLLLIREEFGATGFDPAESADLPLSEVSGRLAVGDGAAAV